MAAGVVQYQTLGRVLLGVSIAVFGVQDLVIGELAPGILPAQSWTPPLPIADPVLGVLFIAMGVGLVAPRAAGRAALAIPIVFGIAVLAINYNHPYLVYAQGTPRTRVLEPLALGSAALVLAVALGAIGTHHVVYDRVGRGLFAFCTAVFGVQHFLYTTYVAALIPAWMPLHRELTYVTGCAFVAAAIAIATGLQRQLGARSLALMFALFVIIVHGPRVYGAFHVGSEWAGLFIAVGMCGASLIIAEPAATAGTTRRW